MKRIFRLLLAVWFLCFCVITLKKEAIFTSFFHNVKDIFTGQLLQKEKEEVVYDDLYHPYYALLDEKEKRIYAKIIDCTNALETTLKPYDADITEKNIANAYQAVMFDCPELFWLEQGYSYEVLEKGIQKIICVQAVSMIHCMKERIQKIIHQRFSILILLKEITLKLK